MNKCGQCEAIQSREIYHLICLTFIHYRMSFTFSVHLFRLQKPAVKKHDTNQSWG